MKQRLAAYLQTRFHAWFENRLPLADHVMLTQRTVYILPTRPGWMLVLTLMVLLVASINYQLNLGYLLTFLLAGCAVVGMHVCHGTLRGLSLNLIAPGAHFMGAAAAFDVKLTSSANSVRHGVGLAVMHRRPHWSWADVPAGGSANVQIAFTPERRGLHRIPTLTAETRFPLGTFRVWTVWRPAASVLVYPAPEAAPPPLPAGQPRSGGAANAARAQDTSEFDGVRSYRRGDPVKLVVWKKAAKHDENSLSESAGLVVRDTQQAHSQELWLDFAQAGVGGVEAKLSRLCAWVLQSDKLGLDYGLRLPGREIKPASGEAHKRQCLEALALC